MRALTEDETARVVNAALSESADALQALRADATALAAIARAAALIVDAFARGGRVFSCGNGGSMCDAMHLAEELSGRFRGNRKGLPAQAISDAGYLSCVANDFGYDAVFRRQIEALGRKGDVAVGISTSGRSPSVVTALARAREMGLVTVGMTGNGGGALAGQVDYLIDVPSPATPRIQEVHALVIHVLCAIVEEAIAG